MSLYNLVNGVTPATFFILPVLGKHPDSYPRFRDCFLFDEQRPEFDGKIHIYTRVGGGNRDAYDEQIEELRRNPLYVTDYDDDFDNTFATFVFDIPPEFKQDIENAKKMLLADLSPKYREKLYEVFPKLKDRFDELFAKAAIAKAEGKTE